MNLDIYSVSHRLSVGFSGLTRTTWGETYLLPYVGIYVKISLKLMQHVVVFSSNKFSISLNLFLSPLISRLLLCPPIASLAPHL